MRPGAVGERRTLPPTTRVIAWIADLWLPAVWLTVALPWLGVSFAESGAVTMFRETVDVPAEVVRATWVSEDRGKRRRWHGYRVEARFEYAGQERFAVGYVPAVPPDNSVLARVAVHRPDLADAFVGAGPHVRSGWITAIVSAALGSAGFVLLLSAARTRVRRLETGRIVRARVLASTEERRKTSVHMVYRTPGGDAELRLRLDRRQAARVLADEAPVLVTVDGDGRPPLALGEVAGLRWDDATGTFAPAAVGVLLQRGLPLVAMVLAGAYGLIASGLLPPL